MNSAIKKPSAEDKKNAQIYFAITGEDKKVLTEVMSLEDRKQADAVSSIVSQYLPYRKKMAMPFTLPRSIPVGKYKVVFSETKDALEVAINLNGNQQALLTFNQKNSADLKDLVTVLLMFANRI